MRYYSCDTCNFCKKKFDKNCVSFDTRGNFVCKFCKNILLPINVDEEEFDFIISQYEWKPVLPLIKID